jgi:hypothetical protein
LVDSTAAATVALWDASTVGNWADCSAATMVVCSVGCSAAPMAVDWAATSAWLSAAPTVRYSVP